MPTDRRPGPALPQRMPNRCRTMPTEPGRPRACSARSCATTGPGQACPQKDLAAQATVSHDVISKIETGERPPAEDFPPRLDAVPELDTRGALTRLRDHLKKGHKQRLYGWFQQWAGIEAQATVLRWYEPLVVPGLLQTEEYARAILSARPDENLDDLDEQVAARLARQAILDRTGCAPALVHPRRGRPAPRHRRQQGHAKPALPPGRGGRAAEDHHPGHPLRQRPRGPARWVHRRSRQQATGGLPGDKRKGRSPTAPRISPIDADPPSSASA